MTILNALKSRAYERVVAEIGALDWEGRSEQEMVTAAWAYYYFSIQFRENLEIACEMYPEDPDLAKLKREECNSDNVSPFAGVAAAGERMDHDEFMRRLLLLRPIDAATQARFAEMGECYLREVREMDPMARALSISSYEDGGLQAVFTAILRAPEYDNPLLAAFRFFLREHIKFDSDPEGHGMLSRRLVPDESIVPVWTAFKALFVDFTPGLLDGDAAVADRSRHERVC
jgi:hypothetical protein